MVSATYVYKSRIKRVLVASFDCLGGLLMLPKRLLTKPSRPSLKSARVLIPRLDHIGDVFLTLPVYQALCKENPEAEFVLVVDESLKPVLSNVGVSSIHGISTGHWFSRKGNLFSSVSTFFSLLSWVRKKKFDVAIDFRGDLLTTLMIFFAGIPCRYGRPEAGGGFLLTESVKRPLSGHEVEHNYQLVESLLTIQNCGDKSSQGVISSAKGSGLVTATEGAINIALHPHAGYPSKEWRADCWDALLVKLAALDRTRVYILGTEGERAQMPLLDVQDFVTDLRGELELKELPSFIQSVDLFVGLDSGPAHLAAYLGTECVSLFSGANTIERWKPYTKKLTLIHTEVDCSPCNASACPLEHQNCMNLIDVDKVFAEIKAVLDRQHTELN